MSVLGNKCSNDLKLTIISKEDYYQLVPPHQHRWSTAEKAIRTLKNHLLSTCNQTYPVTEWDCLSLQYTMTLNLLRHSRINYNLSTYASVNRIIDFSKIPIALPGQKIIIYSKPSQREGWAYHGLEG